MVFPITLREALETRAPNRTPDHEALGFIVAHYSRAHGCLSCGQPHTVFACAPFDAMEAHAPPTLLRCPNTQRRLVVLVPLVGRCMLREITCPECGSPMHVKRGRGALPAVAFDQCAACGHVGAFLPESE